MEPTIHINIGYIISIFSLIGIIGGFLIWVLTLVLKHASKQQLTDSTILAMQKEIDLLKSDKVSKVDFIEFTSELKHLTKSIDDTKKSIDDIKLLMINYKKDQ